MCVQSVGTATQAAVREVESRVGFAVLLPVSDARPVEKVYIHMLAPLETRMQRGEGKAGRGKEHRTPQGEVFFHRT